MLNNIAALMGGASAAVATDYESIQTYTVGAGGQATVTFSSIPSTYSHLQIRALVKPATTSTWLLTRFNGSSASKYAYHELLGSGAAASAAGAGTQNTMISMDNMSNANFGAAVIDVLDYSNTNKYKTLRSLAGQDNNGSGYIGLYSGFYWNDTTAISQIDLTMSSGNLAQYSSFALYGIK